MYLAPTNQETLALALSIENGIKLGNESEALLIANGTIDNYIGSILQKISNNENHMIEVKPVSVIHDLSNTQFWVLCYVAVQQTLTQLQGNLSYTLMSAIATFKEENPEINIDAEMFTTVDVTNIVFQTEYDLGVAFIGLEHILSIVVNNQQQLQNEITKQNKEGETK